MLADVRWVALFQSHFLSATGSHLRACRCLLRSHCASYFFKHIAPLSAVPEMQEAAPHNHVDKKQPTECEAAWSCARLARVLSSREPKSQACAAGCSQADEQSVCSGSTKYWSDRPRGAGTHCPVPKFSVPKCAATPVARGWIVDMRAVQERGQKTSDRCEEEIL